MSKEQSPQTNTVPETYIQDPTLAVEVAYGEKPYRELAQAAGQLGLHEQVGEMSQKADEAGVAAGQAFIATKQSELDAMRANLEAGDVVSTAGAEKESAFETKVASTIAALAERYNAPAEDFGLVRYETEDGATKHYVMHTGLSGIDLGDPNKNFDPKRSYNSLMADDSHIIAIDGFMRDTRKLTEAGYKAFIDQEIGKGTQPLPDSVDLQNVEGEGVWTVTLLPGEATGDADARYGDVDDGQSYSRWFLRGDASHGVRFRPAVEILAD